MSNQYLLLDEEIFEVSLSRRNDGNFVDTLSGVVYSPEQLERGSLYGDKESAFQTRVALEATAGNYSRYGTYSLIQR